MLNTYTEILHDLKRVAINMKEVEAWHYRQVIILDKLHKDVEKLIEKAKANDSK